MTTGSASGANNAAAPNVAAGAAAAAAAGAATVAGALAALRADADAPSPCSDDQRLAACAAKTLVPAPTTSPSVAAAVRPAVRPSSERAKRGAAAIGTIVVTAVSRYWVI